jgi:parallel beta-helix repeat protein
VGTSRFWRIVAAVVTPALVVGVVVAAGAGTALFGGSSAAARATKQACSSLVTSVVETTQRFIAGFDTDVPALPGPSAQATVPIDNKMTQDQFTTVLNNSRARIDSLGCEMTQFRTDLGKGLQHVEGKGVLAQALVRQLRVSLSGKLPESAVTRHAGPDADLDQALAEMPEGSTLVLAAGTYSRSQPLVLLRSVTLAGAGSATTDVASSAGGVTVLIMGGVKATLRDVAITPAPSTVASGILAGAGAAVTLTRTRIAGAHSDGQGHGGSAVLVVGTVSPGRADAPQTSLDVSESEFADNDAAGVAVAGVTAVTVRNSAFRRNKECGVCFIGASAGTVQGNIFKRNAVGVAVTATSHPTIRGNTFRGDRFAVQAGDRSRPVIAGNTIAAATGAAVLYLGQAAGRATRNRCSNDKFDIVARRGTSPLLTGGTCRSTPFG